MDLLEYQAKKLFRQVGIPVLPSETIANPRELKQLQIPYPVVLKSQVKVGGRGKAGGVKFVTNTIDAIAAARNIFNLSILGEYPEVILAEARYDAQKELFLAVVLDYQLKCPVIFGSISGGMDIKGLVKNLQQVAIKTEFSPFMARGLAVQMGLSGELLLAVSKILEKMYRLFQAKDLDLIEINPLGVDSEGNLMALDGKIAVSDAALGRHPELVNLSGLAKERVSSKTTDIFGNSSAIVTQTLQPTEIRWLDWQNSQGKIALLTNNEDLNLLCWDLICQRKEKPACALVVNGLPAKEQLQEVWAKLQSTSKIKVLLIDLWGTEDINKAIAGMIFELQELASPTRLSNTEEARAIVPTNESKKRSRRSPKEDLEADPADSSVMKLVIRLADENIAFYQQEFCHETIFWTNDLEEALSQAISFSKTT